MKKGRILFFVSIFVILSLGVLVKGGDLTAVTLSTPAANANINGTYNFTSTTTGTGDNVSFFYSTDSGSTWNLICVGGNDSATSTTFSCASATSGITDAADLIFNASATTDYNSSFLYFSDTSTGVDVDNTVPVCDLRFPENPSGNLDVDSSFLCQ